MKLKYWGTAYEKGLTLTADMFTTEGTPVHVGFPMTETVAGSSAIYKTADVLVTTGTLSPGIYVVRVVNSSGDFLGFDEIIFNGVREITLLELKFMSEEEMMQLRDALGIDGNKMIARNGQLQKKSEAPYNNIIDTNSFKQ